jgi:hypothetical protein
MEIDSYVIVLLMWCVICLLAGILFSGSGS